MPLQLQLQFQIWGRLHHVQQYMQNQAHFTLHLWEWRWICLLKQWFLPFKKPHGWGWGGGFPSSKVTIWRQPSFQMTIILLLSWILTQNHNSLSATSREWIGDSEKLLIKAISGLTRVVNLGLHSGVTALCESGVKFGISCLLANNTYITLMQFCHCCARP